MIPEGMKFTEHIDELRARVKVVFYVFFLILVVVVFFPADPVQQAQHLDQYLNLQFLANTLVAAFLHSILAYVLPPGWTLIAAKGLGEGMEVYFIAAMLLSIAVCMPVIAYETYKFIDPALKPEERQLVYPFVVSTSVLFTVGVAFGFFVLSKFLVQALSPFLGATGTQFQIDSASFYYVIFLIIGSAGFSFTAPVFVYAVIRLGVLHASFFSRNRVLIWFGIWVITGLFLTPDGGPLLDLVIFAPIVALVEAAVWFGRRSERSSETIIGNLQANSCRNCGARLPQGGVFCPSCGKSLV